MIAHVDVKEVALVAADLDVVLPGPSRAVVSAGAAVSSSHTHSRVGAAFSADPFRPVQR